MDRNALIVRNRIEALDRQRTDLHREIAEAERRNAELLAEYDRRLAAAKNSEEGLSRTRRRSLREGLAIGFGMTLVLALFAMLLH